MNLRIFRNASLTAALALSAGTMFAQGYPAQPQGNYPQQQGNYPQQQQSYGDHDRDRDRNGWDAAPDDLRSDVQRRGFQDGLIGARQDFDSQRQPNVAGRPEYRHPHVPKRVRNDYREGYQRGYDVAVRHRLERHDRDDHDRDRDHDRPDGYQPR